MSGVLAARERDLMSNSVTNIYVGNLAWSATEDDVREAFEEHGTVTSVYVIMDRDTGRPRGFAFVEMPDKEQAEAAIEKVNGVEICGRPVQVNETRPREERTRSGGGGGGRDRDRDRDRDGRGSGYGRR